ncbi:hypothetical protein EXS54_00830 [Patescibacteria group bacterium]|nr:hypothetical protein [Patescibacteria group bacterium]
MTTFVIDSLHPAFEQAIERAHAGEFPGLTPAELFGEHRSFSQLEKTELSLLAQEELGVSATIVSNILDGSSDLQIPSEDWTDIATGNLEPNLVLQGRKFICATGARVNLRLALN